MVVVIKLFHAAFLATTVLCAAELKDIKSVYLYPMRGGLDQHLANRLTQDKTFRVVADPKLADAIFTDQLGSTFEYRMDHLKPAVVPASGAAAQPQPATTTGSNTVTTAYSQETEPHTSSFSRGKGTVFLVEAKSRQVVWSGYKKSKGTSASEVEHTARYMAKSLAKTLAPTTPESK